MTNLDQRQQNKPQPRVNATMKLPPSSSIALANLPLISASALLRTIRHEYRSDSNRNNNADTGILQTITDESSNDNAAPSLFRKLQECPSGCSAALCSCFSSTVSQCHEELADVCSGYSSDLSDCIAGAVDRGSAVARQQ